MPVEYLSAEQEARYGRFATELDLGEASLSGVLGWWSLSFFELATDQVTAHTAQRARPPSC